MTQGDGSAVRIDVLRALFHSKSAEHGYALGGERFVEFDDVEICRFKSQTRAEALCCSCRADAHDARFDTGRDAAQNARDRLQALFVDRIL